MKCDGCNNISHLIPGVREGSFARCPVYLENMRKNKVKELLYPNPGTENPGIKTFDELDYAINPIKDKVDEIREWMKGTGKRLFISSPNGTGKTTILGAMVCWYMQKKISVCYLTASTFHRLKNKEHTEKETTGAEKNLMDSFRSANVRIIDELGGERATDFFHNELQKVLDDHTRKLILSGNRWPGAPTKDAALVYELRLMSRLNGIPVIHWKGQDMRLHGYI